MEPVGFFRKLSTISRETIAALKANPELTFRVLAGLVVYTLVTLLVYAVIDGVDPSITDANLIARGIETPGKLWLNGYLGLFFAFGYMGNINWLALPVLLYLLFSIRNRPHWQKALILFFVLAVCLVGLKGYFNRRYALTLLPMTLSLVVYATWRLSEHFRLLPYMRLVLFIGLLGILANDARYFLNLHKEQKQVEILEPEGPGLLERIENKIHWMGSLGPVIKKRVRNFWRKPELLGPFLKVKIKNIALTLPNYWVYVEKPFVFKQKPEMMMAFIKNLKLEKGERILNNNLPIQWHFTEQRGIYYWCEDDDYYTAKGKAKLLAKYKGYELSKHLVNDLKVRYILSFKPYDDYNLEWKNYLKNFCITAYIDHSQYVLYKVVIL
jgi:hypothetical protein